MGFLDHLFKTKPNEEKAGEERRESSEPAAPAAVEPDPGSFLRPKSVLPRHGATVYPALRPSPVPGRVEPIGEPRREIVLTLGDVLSRIPTQVLQAGFHDAQRELRFSIAELSADIARGRAAVPLSKIAALCPDVFCRPITAQDDSEIRLPLQKLVEQIGLLRGRPVMSPESGLMDSRPPANAAILEAADTQVALAEFLAQPDANPVSATLPPPPMPPSEESPAAHEPAPAPPSLPEPAVSGILIHPPPVVRPILVAPPPILAVSLPAPSAPLAACPESPPSAESVPPPEVAPPAPASPANFDALQALFMTEESLDLAAICRHVAALPGVRACTIGLRDAKVSAGEWPEGIDRALLEPAATELNDVARSLGTPPLGPWQNATLYAEQGAISFFARRGLLLVALHRAFPPGVRERLVTVVEELAPR